MLQDRHSIVGVLRDAGGRRIIGYVTGQLLEGRGMLLVQEASNQNYIQLVNVLTGISYHFTGCLLGFYHCEPETNLC